MPPSTKKRRVASKRKTAKRRVAGSKASKNGIASSHAVEGRAALVAGSSSKVEPPSTEEEAAFTEALIESGQAARLDKDGKLPKGATHKIIEDEAGQTKVVRRRFSIA